MHPFTAVPGITNTNLETPLDFFNQFFTSDVKDLIYKETTRFAEQELTSSIEYLQEHPHARGNEWKRCPMERREIDPFLSIIITMGIVGYPSLR